MVISNHSRFVGQVEMMLFLTVVFFWLEQLVKGTYGAQKMTLYMPFWPLFSGWLPWHIIPYISGCFPVSPTQKKTTHLNAIKYITKLVIGSKICFRSFQMVSSCIICDSQFLEKFNNVVNYILSKTDWQLEMQFGKSKFIARSCLSLSNHFKY